MSDEKATNTEAAKASKEARVPARRDYEVANASIFYENEEGATVRGRKGETVSLTASQAKHFNKINALKPVVAED